MLRVGRPSAHANLARLVLNLPSRGYFHFLFPNRLHPRLRGLMSCYLSSLTGRLDDHENFARSTLEPLKIRVLHRKHSRDTLENVYHPFGVCRATQAADDRLGSRIQSCHVEELRLRLSVDRPQPMSMSKKEQPGSIGHWSGVNLVT